MFRKMRRFNQLLSDEDCRKVLVEGKRAALGVYGEDGYPYVLPVNYVFEEEENCIYIHSALEGHKIDAMRHNAKVCLTVWTNGYKEEGHWEDTVHSVIVFGTAVLLDDEKVREEKLRHLAKRYYPSDEEIERVMSHAVSRVQLVRISIDHMTGKIVHEK